ncbi:MAG: phosphoribosyl-ATP diphosphatase [Aquabacterium sp.]|uniref:phosphoribosyl-ATP diphosphatase n=1 Tax=Aquabacterium sp. TaxID=1872578 RepID=UPI0025C290A1|nr:phosphoribosyl-ATP diphosphatase [Aquabacterium sp.]MBI5927241.1 phosphoribosyl-ATP diphosphatase [Aquabacterium sp.]
MSATPPTPNSTATSLDVLMRLAEVIESRKGGDPDKSYVARLFHKGTDTVLKKVGEEATETVMAGKDMAANPSDANRKALVGEFADLWFHAMVAMSHLGLHPHEVVGELARREGLSGLEEFAMRGKVKTSEGGAS